MPNSNSNGKNDPPTDPLLSPPFSPISDRSSSDSQTTINSSNSAWETPPESQRLPRPKYAVASHSVRITKFGYAIDPIELKYPEIIKNISKSSIRQSKISFNSNSIGYKFLNLIRSFWSQPGFPRGQMAEQTQNSTVISLLHDFIQNPIYPHKRTYIAASDIGKSRKKLKRVKVSSSTSSSSSSLSSTPVRKNSTSKSIKAISLAPVDDLGRIVTSRILSFGKVPSISSEVVPPPQSPSVRTRVVDKKSDNITEFTSAYYAANSKSQSKSGSSSKSQSSSSDFYRSWIPKDKDQIVDLITTFCLHMEDVFANEPRIVNISTPCLVLGDIHGNLTDLRTYERSLWPKAPNCVTCNYLFLGDYVDRGDYSIECILYLFALKLISPKRFFLLRGNHEVAPIQRQYTFSKECDLKFGPSGKEIWRNFNRVFDFMPIAAIIDNQIFCAHGGIPKSIVDIKTLSESIPSPMDNPEVQCPAAWEILWNDPITDSELVSLIEMDNAYVTNNQRNNDDPLTDATSIVAESRLTTVSSDTSSIASTTPQQIVNDGFIANIKRGTAYLFSDRAINNFLQVNKLTHIIRAHEVIPTGFAFHGDGRVITIFSSSKYCGLNNQAACILVDQDRIRVLRLDTGDEGE